MDLVYKNEKTLFMLMLVLSLVVWWRCSAEGIVADALPVDCR